MRTTSWFRRGTIADPPGWLRRRRTRFSRCVSRARRRTTRPRRRLDRHLRQLPWRQSHRAATGERIARGQVFPELLEAFRKVAAVGRDVSQCTAGTIQFGGRAGGASRHPLAVGNSLAHFDATGGTFGCFRPSLHGATPDKQRHAVEKAFTDTHTRPARGQIVPVGKAFHEPQVVLQCALGIEKGIRRDGLHCALVKC
ncbi:hypothetical protein A5680_18415 [Mycobacterium sp. E2989]|nr:hypothetical protein A5680_18415 [Mycobacterium sp. E2989]